MTAVGLVRGAGAAGPPLLLQDESWQNAMYRSLMKELNEAMALPGGAGPDPVRPAPHVPPQPSGRPGSPQVQALPARPVSPPPMSPLPEAVPGRPASPQAHGVPAVPVSPRPAVPLPQCGPAPGRSVSPQANVPPAMPVSPGVAGTGRSSGTGAHWQSAPAHAINTAKKASHSAPGPAHGSASKPVQAPRCDPALTPPQDREREKECRGGRADPNTSALSAFMLDNSPFSPSHAGEQAPARCVSPDLNGRERTGRASRAWMSMCGPAAAAGGSNNGTGGGTDQGGMGGVRGFS